MLVKHENGDQATMNRNIYDIIRELVAWTAPPETAVLSLYLDVSPAAPEDAVEFARTACKELLGEHEFARGDEAFAALVIDELDILPRLVHKARQGDYDGLALFLCADPLLKANVRLRFAFENQALIGRDPFLRHLLVYAEEYERCLCVVLMNEMAYLGDIHVGELTDVKEVKPSERRDLYEEVSVALARMVRDDPQLHVMLFAPVSERHRLESILSRDVLSRVIDRLDEPIHPHATEFLRTVHRCLQNYERRTEAAGVARLFRLREEDGQVAIGTDETLQTINRGKIKVLYALQSFSERGWLCDVCDCLGCLPAPPCCVACGASVSPVPLEEHIFDQAAACGAEIETVYENEMLAQAEGIGALIDEP